MLQFFRSILAPPINQPPVLAPCINQPLIDAAVTAAATCKIAPLIPLLNQMDDSNYDPRILGNFSIAGGFKGNLFHIIAFADDWRTEFSKINKNKLSFLHQKGLNLNEHLPNDALGTVATFQVPLTLPIEIAVGRQGVSSFVLFLIDRGADLSSDRLILELMNQCTLALPMQSLIDPQNQLPFAALHTATLVWTFLGNQQRIAQLLPPNSTLMLQNFPNESLQHSFYAICLAWIDRLFLSKPNSGITPDQVKSYFDFYSTFHNNLLPAFQTAERLLLDDAAKRYFLHKERGVEISEGKLLSLPEEVQLKIKEIAQRRASRPLRGLCVNRIVSFLDSVPGLARLPQHIQTEVNNLKDSRNSGAPA